MTNLIEATLETTEPLGMDAGGDTTMVCDIADSGATMECEMGNGVLELSKYMKWEDFNKLNVVRFGGEDPTDGEN